MILYEMIYHGKPYYNTIIQPHINNKIRQYLKCIVFFNMLVERHT